MERSNLRIMVRTIFVSYVLTAIFLVLLAFCLFRFHLGESQVNMGVNVIYIAACLIGGIVAGKSARVKRFIWGFLSGCLYFLILAGVSFLINKGIGSNLGELALTFAMCAGSGTIGGMIS